MAQRKGATMSPLENRLDELIARFLGVSPEEVTTEFIHGWREKHIYPRAKYDFSTHYGGYAPPNKIVFSPVELEEMANRADKFLAQFA